MQKRKLKRAAMYISIGAELIAVVGIALAFAFKANLFNLLYFIPHVVWYGAVIAYVAVSTRDPEAAARRKAEKDQDTKDLRRLYALGVDCAIAAQGLITQG